LGEVHVLVGHLCLVGDPDYLEEVLEDVTREDLG
jgi:hypothetical protein